MSNNEEQLQVALEYGMKLYERAVEERRRLEEENSVLRTQVKILLQAIGAGTYDVNPDDPVPGARVEVGEIEGQFKLFVEADDE